MSFAKFFQQAGWHKLPYKTFVVKLKTILKLYKIHQPQSHLITASFLHISEFWRNCLSFNLFKNPNLRSQASWSSQIWRTEFGKGEKRKGPCFVGGAQRGGCMDLSKLINGFV